MRLKKVVSSGWFGYALLMGGAWWFEYQTKPWSMTVIPSPYVMIYGIGTTLLALKGYGWGLLASLSWWISRHYYWVWADTPEYLFAPDQFVRLSLHLIWPLAVSWYAAQKREAERQKDLLLLILGTGIPHQFNNLLMVIMGNASSLMDDSRREDPEERRQLQQILEAAQKAAEMVRTIRRDAQAGRVTEALEKTAHPFPSASERSWLSQ